MWVFAPEFTAKQGEWGGGVTGKGRTATQATCWITSWQTEMHETTSSKTTKIRKDGKQRDWNKLEARWNKIRVPRTSVCVWVEILQQNVSKVYASYMYMWWGSLYLWSPVGCFSVMCTAPSNYFYPRKQKDFFWGFFFWVFLLFLWCFHDLIALNFSRRCVSLHQWQLFNQTILKMRLAISSLQLDSRT